MTTATTSFFYARATIYTGGILGCKRTEVRNLSIDTGQKYAQYTNAIRVEYVEKGKRKPRAMMLTYNPFLMVVDGWGGPAISDGMTAAVIHEATGLTVTESKYPSCDPRYQSDARAELAASGATIEFDASENG